MVHNLFDCLKQNPNRKFYYYPDMTVEKVVLYKQFHRFRNETIIRMLVLRTAFPDPAVDKSSQGNFFLYLA